MTLEKKIMHDLKNAMLSKNSVQLEVCRAIKSAILISKTEKLSSNLNVSKEMEILQKLLKQRKESEKIYLEQGRLDLAQEENAQAELISKYLPEPYSLSELEEIVNMIMREMEITEKKDMGKLMAAVIKKVNGKSDGKTISQVVSQKLI